MSNSEAEAKSDYLRYLEESYIGENEDLKNIFNSVVNRMMSQNQKALEDVMDVLLVEVQNARKENTELKGLISQFMDDSRTDSETFKNEMSESVDELHHHFGQLSNSLKVLATVTFVNIALVISFVGFVVFGI